ncbi:sugar ABC transporter substrate-binding protein [Halomonas sp. FeN2]|uniref:Sugar ABC transporter substrate-binding protein n=1 Tax=Vreelandella neptunia TaxID=115551 RepID=A0ABZ0YRU3_9GAMM|nr:MULTISPECIES: sugar ABC transporter substrate-binding protein [Halomonas]TDV98078.1 sorbitol/mannitol transport system substrate-binding protein [Halomonas alkaliantarctica]MBF59272.1 sugar ABC transporter substrate-binding protein [Halomonas sp.]MDN3558979.1 sugar ABC transporter substrate-binding protein [Halomonas neptunia]UBR49133.1 sugar ABC transporter substrate-binding protein [Halomonas sp. FeN2]WQH13942.1 sugar ABC transporter substrate-binding protein [Halomonas neptunia]|tara:strand:+ start:515 stop:1834 length:1320 start_codon:yes stop_codon:yes gene_type:complete
MRLARHLPVTTLAAAIAMSGHAQAQTEITVATVNNNDMVIMQSLTEAFEEAHPDITLDWVVLEENVLRQRMTTDIATGGGQFDVMTIGTYEVPIWAERGWLSPLDNLPDDYNEDDLLTSVRDGLSLDGTLHALPFYAESSMMYYRQDLFEEAGIEMSDQPTWEEVREWAGELHGSEEGLAGICLRGKPGWGENMAFVSTLVNTYGGRWFDEEWNPELNSEAWVNAIQFYVDLLNDYGPPGASSNGFNENLALFSRGNCAMWVDATSAAGKLYDGNESDVADSLGFAPAPIAKTPKGSHWLWSWALAIPASSENQEAAREFITWATSQEYIELVGETQGWTSVPPGTRESTYANEQYTEAAPFADFVLKAIQDADPTDSTLEPNPYVGVQFVGIPEFQSIGTQVGQTIAAALTGDTTVEQALDSAQRATERTMQRAGYLD